ncbi:MAG: histidine kinase [Polyangiales bacterium]
MTPTAEQEEIATERIAQLRVHRHAPLAVALWFGVAGVAIVANHAPALAWIFGNVPEDLAMRLAITLAGSFAVTSASIRFLGARARVSRALHVVDGFVQFSTLALLIYISGSARSLIWLVLIGKAYLWTPPFPHERPWKLMQLVFAHGALGAAFLLQGQYGDAMFDGLAFAAAYLGHAMTIRMSNAMLQSHVEHQLLERRLRAAHRSAERDRVARQLHDGVAADMTALVLQLRLAAMRDDGAVLARIEALVARTQRALGSLRAVVWSLRGGSDSLRELLKLVEAKCTSVHAGLLFKNDVPRDVDARRISSSDALATVTAADMLLRNVPTPSATPITVRVSMDGNALTLDVVTAANQNSIRVSLDREPRAAALEAQVS